MNQRSFVFEKLFILYIVWCNLNKKFLSENILILKIYQKSVNYSISVLKFIYENVHFVRKKFLKINLSQFIILKFDFMKS